MAGTLPVQPGVKGKSRPQIPAPGAAKAVEGTHNPKIGGSNPPPATTPNADSASWVGVRHFWQARSSSPHLPRTACSRLASTSERAPPLPVAVARPSPTQPQRVMPERASTSGTRRRRAPLRRAGAAFFAGVLLVRRGGNASGLRPGRLRAARRRPSRHPGYGRGPPRVRQALRLRLVLPPERRGERRRLGALRRPRRAGSQRRLKPKRAEGEARCALPPHRPDRAGLRYRRAPPGPARRAHAQGHDRPEARGLAAPRRWPEQSWVPIEVSA